MNLTPSAFEVHVPAHGHDEGFALLGSATLAGTRKVVVTAVRAGAALSLLPRLTAPHP